MVKQKKNYKIDFKYNIGVYWSFLKKHKALFFGVLLLVLVVETLFIADKFLFKIIIDSGTEFVAGNLLADGFVKILLVILVVFVTFAITRTLGAWLKLHFLIILDAKMVVDLKTYYFNHIVDLSHQFHTTHKTGSMISRMMRGSGALEDMNGILTTNFAPTIASLFVVAFSIAYFSLAPAIAILVTAVVFVSYSYYIQHIQQGPKLEFIANDDCEKGMVSDIFTNIDSIKYFGKEKQIKLRFNKQINKTRKADVKQSGYYRWFDAGQVFILAVGILIMMYFPITNFIAGEITLGTLVFIFTVYGNVVGPMFGFVWGMRGFYRAMTNFQDLFYYGKIENEIKDKKGAKDLEVRKGEINFKDVSFHYAKKKSFGVDKFNLKIKPNEKIAFVGHSGCGKTTLIKLLYRLYDVQEGGILIDGKDIRDFKQESLRGEFSIVPQECVLFDDTIFNNIKFADPKASREEVRNAIRFAQLDKVIKNFANGESTIVGERGVKLSGGEKQRVSIARALLANKRVLVLDEATSALDSETEHEIQRYLAKLLEGRTSIIIAHRLSTIMNSDRIIVLKSGKIIQDGKHADLIRQPGEYKKLWNLQKGGYIK